MRIAIWHNLPSGGGKRALYDQVRGLMGLGHYIEVWRPPTADSTYLPLDTIVRENVRPLAWPAGNIFDRLTRISSDIAPALRAMSDHCRECADEIMAGQFDVLLVHPCLFFRTSPIARFVDLPNVLYLQEPFRGLYEAQPRLPWLPPRQPLSATNIVKRIHLKLKDFRQLHNARVQGFHEIENASAFRRILVNSLFSRESVLRCYGLDSDVCYLGTDVSQFVDLNLDRERTVVGLGTFTVEKNVSLVIEALALLPDPKPDLVWIGNADYGGHMASMQSLADSLGVRFTARLRISDNEVIQILNRAGAMVYAPRLEPFGFAPIEAGACALPVIAVAEGGVRETVLDGVTGLLVYNHPHAVADAISLLLNDTALARKLGVAGRENAEQRWSLAAATARIERALLDIARL